ncbi:MAG: hypothetical protein O7A06_06670 [Acidobacteria bacterium]|nr:hypothetical protein [Acidobacteriota bacterium]MCZ6751613.1 hypothetical protein [Acidobacteriota bacterium]
MSTTTGAGDRNYPADAAHINWMSLNVNFVFEKADLADQFTLFVAEEMPILRSPLQAEVICTEYVCPPTL